MARVPARRRVPIIRVSALSFINVVAFSAMAGVVGGGGLGNLAIIRGYNRFQSDVTLVATLIILSSCSSAS